MRVGGGVGEVKIYPYKKKGGEGGGGGGVLAILKGGRGARNILRQSF